MSVLDCDKAVHFLLFFCLKKSICIQTIESDVVTAIANAYWLLVTGYCLLLTAHRGTGYTMFTNKYNVFHRVKKKRNSKSVYRRS